MRRAARKQEAVTLERVDLAMFDRLIEEARRIADMPVVKTEYFLGGESIGCAEPLLCPYELSSLLALIGHVAQNRNRPERDIRALVEAEFSVPGLAQIRHKDFRHAIAFLTDLRIDGAGR